MSIRLVAEILFWTNVALLVYSYAGYALVVAIASRVRPRAVRRAESAPLVSVIIAAYNEERDLHRKLENTLALDYPAEKLEIIVVSDCSTDRTDEIARGFTARGVRLYRQPVRLGKTAAQNAAVQQAHGEILLFSDATTLYRPDVLRAIVPSFADSSVGCVAGQLIYVDPSRTNVGRAARSYWSYETFLKRCESRIGSLIGVSGCLYAVRRSAYVPLPHEACSDFIIASKMVEQGLRAVFEPGAVCTEETNRRADKELGMRVRIIAQTFGDLWRLRGMMNPLRSGFYAIQLTSHKLLRYLVPFFLAGMLISSVALVPWSLGYAIALITQMCFYASAGFAVLLERCGLRTPILAFPHYFVLSNVAALIGLSQFLRGHRYAHWETSRDPGSSHAPAIVGAETGPVELASKGVRC